MAENLNKGTKEWLIYDVSDKLANLTSLLGTNPRYDVYNPTGTKIVNQAALSVGVPNEMKVYALIDTTDSSFVPDPEPYEVYLQFDTGPESPYLKGGDFILKPSPST